MANLNHPHPKISFVLKESHDAANGFQDTPIPFKKYIRNRQSCPPCLAQRSGKHQTMALFNRQTSPRVSAPSKPVRGFLRKQHHTLDTIGFMEELVGSLPHNHDLKTRALNPMKAGQQNKFRHYHTNGTLLEEGKQNGLRVKYGDTTRIQTEQENQNCYPFYSIQQFERSQKQAKYRVTFAKKESLTNVFQSRSFAGNIQFNTRKQRFSKIGCSLMREPKFRLIESQQKPKDESKMKRRHGLANPFQELYKMLRKSKVGECLQEIFKCYQNLRVYGFTEAEISKLAKHCTASELVISLICQQQKKTLAGEVVYGSICGSIDDVLVNVKNHIFQKIATLDKIHVFLLDYHRKLEATSVERILRRISEKEAAVNQQARMLASRGYLVNNLLSLRYDTSLKNLQRIEIKYGLCDKVSKTNRLVCQKLNNMIRRSS